MSFDLVIRNGTVVDGSGAESYRADVGVLGDRIAQIGRIDEPGREEVDAEGHVVTPGFVDGHTHMDAQVMWDPLGSCSCWHGVTTVVMGNCGFTLAPAHNDARSLAVRNLERAEDISAAAMDAGIDWTWESYPEYLDAVDARPKAINYSGYVGHSALRTWAMGERAFTEPATDDDLAAMDGALIDALDAGAIGLSTSRSAAHETPDNQPVASRLATWDEVRRLVGTMATTGRGVFELAMEREALSRDPEVRADALGRVRDLALDFDVAVTMGVIAAIGMGEHWRDHLAMLDDAAARGARIFGQSHSRGISNVLSFRTTLPFDRLPEWRPVRQLPVDEQIAALRDPACREALVAAAINGDYGRFIGTEARPPDLERLALLDGGLPPHRLVRDVAADRGMHPVELMVDLAVESGFDQLFIQPISDPDHDIVLEIMRHPRAVMTFSDSGAHVSQILDASITTHLLGYWVRDEQAFTLEQAVQMITCAPALAWGFADRGLVREGMIADLNVFDPDTIAPALPRVVDDLPGGAQRLVQPSIGIKATIVAGEVVMADGEHTGRLPGQLLRVG